MSYILDALRRAEAERARERGKVPGLHDPSPAGSPAPAATGQRRRGGGGAWLVGGGLVLVAAVAGAWVWFDGAEPAQPVAGAGPAARGTSAPVGPSVTTPTTPTTSTTPTTTPTTPTTSPPSTPPPLTTPAPAPAARGPSVASSSSLTDPSSSVAPRELAPVPALPRSEPVEPRATVASAAAIRASAPRILEPGELPDDVRRALPPLSFGGAMYSDTPSARLLIVNGQVLHEGDAVAKDLVLEQIRLKTAVLAFRGYRYLVTF